MGDEHIVTDLNHSFALGIGLNVLFVLTEAGFLAVPAHIDLLAVKYHLASLDGVAGYHDLHACPLDTPDFLKTSNRGSPFDH
jgi:hypothetical protein